MGAACAPLHAPEGGYGESHTEERWGKTLSGQQPGVRYAVVSCPTKKDQDRWGHFALETKAGELEAVR